MPNCARLRINISISRNFILKKFDYLQRLKKSIEGSLKKYGHSSESADFLYRLLALEFKAGEDDAELLMEYLEKLDQFDELAIPYTLKALLGIDPELVRLFERYDQAFDLKEDLSDRFDEVPNFDYLKDKNQFETFGAKTHSRDR